MCQNVGGAMPCIVAWCQCVEELVAAGTLSFSRAPMITGIRYPYKVWFKLRDDLEARFRSRTLKANGNVNLRPCL